MNLLVIDWDFFFPNPWIAKKDMTFEHLLEWDWSHQESRFFIEAIWPIRAIPFLRRGSLPGTSGEEQGFWDHFRFSDDARLYVSDSNCYSGIAPIWSSDVKRVVLCDAHHDSGYNGSAKRLTVRGEVTCDNWMARYRRKKRFVVYPDWHDTNRDGTPEIEVPRLEWSDFDAASVEFDRVHVCRSGAWVPPWLDEQFLDFVDRFPSPAPAAWLDQPENPQAYDIRAWREDAERMLAEEQKVRAGAEGGRH